MSKSIYKKGTSVRNIRLSDEASRALVRNDIYTLHDVLEDEGRALAIIRAAHGKGGDPTMDLNKIRVALASLSRAPSAQHAPPEATRAPDYSAHV